MPSPAPLALVVMGVSGCGKSTVGAALAAHLGWPFLDADDFHPPANRAKMAAGQPLTDADRAPWLATLRDELSAHLARNSGVVLACSALRRAYRDVLRAAAPDGQVRFLHLTVDRSALAHRLQNRPGHFFNPALLDSQLATLESPSPDEPALSFPPTPLPELLDQMQTLLR